MTKMAQRPPVEQEIKENTKSCRNKSKHDEEIKNNKNEREDRNKRKQTYCIRIQK